MQDEIAEQIRRVNANEPGAPDALFAAAYRELHKLARSHLHDGGDRTQLQPTELVHESYLRFSHSGLVHSRDRRGFFSYADCIMRSVVVDLLRERGAQRRGADAEHVELEDDDAIAVADHDGGDIGSVHQALQRLAASEPRAALVVQMRYFGGYSEAEIGRSLQLTERTVRRDWDKARAFLGSMLRH